MRKKNQYEREEIKYIHFYIEYMNGEYLKK